MKELSGKTELEIVVELKELTEEQKWPNVEVANKILT